MTIISEIEESMEDMIVKIECDAVNEFILRRQRESEQDLMRLESVHNTDLYKMMRLLLFTRMQRTIYDTVRIKTCQKLYAKIRKEGEDPLYKEVITVVIDEVMRAHKLDPTVVLGNGIKRNDI